MLRLSVLVVAALAAATTAASAEPYRLAPYKDDLFKYPAVIESKDDGAYVLVSYDKQRDLYGRDEILEKRAKLQYVTPSRQRTIEFRVDGTPLRYIGVGKIDGGAKSVVIYIHGQGGNRFQGANDWTFGGNFNRIMNLMARNDGAYLSPHFSDLEAKGANEIKILMLDQATRSPDAAIFIACGSQGGAICWALARDPEAASHISGLLMLGSSHDDGFFKTAAMKPKGRRIPLYIGHGTADPIFGWEDEAAFYQKVRKAVPSYPIRIALFDSGVHGTPIRMTDWRMVLNWMLEVGGK
jgi:hypothetical protein